jgi:uncharacterized lipoprotein YajG
MKSIIKLITVFMLACLLTSCAFRSQYIENEYHPNTISEEIIGAENIRVAVNVNDVRIKDNVGFIGWNQEYKDFMILTNSNLCTVFKDAIESELEQRGFAITAGGNNLDIEIYKFFNHFVITGFISGKAGSETILHAVLKNANGNILYSKTIYELGEEHSCYLSNGANACLALNKSLTYAVQKLMDDPDFITALLTSN